MSSRIGSQSVSRPALRTPSSRPPRPILPISSSSSSVTRTPAPQVSRRQARSVPSLWSGPSRESCGQRPGAGEKPSRPGRPCACWGRKATGGFSYRFMAPMVGRSAAGSQLFAGNVLALVRYIRSMNASGSVVGCSTCGALYTPAAGDDGVCPTCSSILPVEQPPRPARPAGPNLRSISGRPEAKSFDVDFDEATRPRKRASRRGLRRIAIGAVAAALVAGIGAAIVTRPRPLMQAWTSIRRHSPAEAWTSIRRHSPAEAWTAVRHFALNTWAAVRPHLPFIEGSRAERSASASPSTRETTASRGTHRRSQHGKGKRSGDD